MLLNRYLFESARKLKAYRFSPHLHPNTPRDPCAIFTLSPPFNGYLAGEKSGKSEKRLLIMKAQYEWGFKGRAL